MAEIGSSRAVLIDGSREAVGAEVRSTASALFGQDVQRVEVAPGDKNVLL